METEFNYKETIESAKLYKANYFKKQINLSRWFYIIGLSIVFGYMFAHLLAYVVLL